MEYASKYPDYYPYTYHSGGGRYPPTLVWVKKLKPLEVRRATEQLI